ncbi:2-acyl-glycerophospho-ethanolamine acyltransferase, partial [candidate division KSB3 bacterium]
MQTEINTNNQQKASAAKIFAMAGTYCLGVFNDNYFKQAALLLAVTTGMAHLQGPATVLFSLPFILCSSYAGWIADRFAKRNVVRFSKGLEVIAMLIGAAGILLINWPCILAMIFLMSLQSTFFSPALNASLLGIAIAGLSLDAKWPVSSGLASSRSLIAIVAVGVAVFGFLASLGVYSKEAAGVKRSFPWWGPVSSLKDARDLFADHKLRKAILANTIFYFLASTAVLTINLMGIKQLGFSQSLTSLLSVCLMLGISAGAVLVSRFFSIKQWDRFLFIGILGMAVGLFVAAFTIFVPAAFQKIWIISGLTLAGFAGGVFLIPITSFLQIYPQRSEKGRVLGTTNFCSFIGIMCSGFVFSALSFLFSPAGSMAALGALALCCALLLLLERTTLIFIGSRLLFALLSLRYRITVKGLENIKAGDMRGTLFLPNHPALIDPVLISCILYGKGVYPRPLSDQNQVNKPGIRLLMKLIQPIVIPDMSTEGRGGKARIKEALA